MFRALLAHPQQALHNGTWYTACVLCQLAVPGLEWNCFGQLIPHASNIPSAVCAAPPEDEQVMLETYRGP
jgi:hypothetical protein